MDFPEKSRSSIAKQRYSYLLVWGVCVCERERERETESE